LGDDRLAPLWEALGWHPDPDQQALFAELQNLLRHWNAQLNLTRLVEGEDFWIAQVYDSLWPLADLLRNQQSAATAPLQLVDVGTGGGFPGLALAIALPGAELCLIDSVQRKVEAVRAMAGSLGLGPRVRFCSERVEKLGRAAPWRGGFDWAVARAVAPAPVVAEYLVPLLKANGQALLYRGQWSDDDQRRLSAAARSLNATIAQISRCELPAGRGQRTAIVLKPRQGCPRQYPRAVGIPAKQPLGGVNGAATCA
jgi:16S rRNA (guanine527-N7)-methyltransferase